MRDKQARWASERDDMVRKIGGKYDAEVFE